MKCMDGWFVLKLFFIAFSIWRTEEIKIEQQTEIDLAQLDA